MAEWAVTASQIHKERMEELLETLHDGRWCGNRWWKQQYSSEPEVWELRFDAHAHVFMRIFVDEADGSECADFISIEHSKPPDPDDEHYPPLGEG
ncbi:hypothetical protein [Spirillospora sp. CA-128828]|uniref:hypothetical protein n=1 Tax=Spirillospora sp. CA-128828 TaxID=3240033 RepID=UPI003D8C0F36